MPCAAEWAGLSAVCGHGRDHACLVPARERGLHPRLCLQRTLTPPSACTPGGTRTVYMDQVRTLLWEQPTNTTYRTVGSAGGKRIWCSTAQLLSCTVLYRGVLHCTAVSCSVLYFAALRCCCPRVQRLQAGLAPWSLAGSVKQHQHWATVLYCPVMYRSVHLL